MTNQVSDSLVKEYNQSLTEACTLMYKACLQGKLPSDVETDFMSFVNSMKMRGIGIVLDISSTTNLFEQLGLDNLDKIALKTMLYRPPHLESTKYTPRFTVDACKYLRTKYGYTLTKAKSIVDIIAGLRTWDSSYAPDNTIAYGSYQDWSDEVDYINTNFFQDTGVRLTTDLYIQFSVDGNQKAYWDKSLCKGYIFQTKNQPKVPPSSL